MSTASDARDLKIHNLYNEYRTLDHNLNHGFADSRYFGYSVRRQVAIADELHTLGERTHVAEMLVRAVNTAAHRFSHADPLVEVAVSTLAAHRVAARDHAGAANVWGALAESQQTDTRVTSDAFPLTSVGRQVDHLAKAGLHREVERVTTGLLPAIDASLGRHSETAHNVRMARANALLANARTQPVADPSRAARLAGAMRLSMNAAINARNAPGIGATHPRALAALSTSARILVAQGKHQEAAGAYSRLVPQIQKVHGRTSAQYLGARKEQVALQMRLKAAQVTTRAEQRLAERMRHPDPPMVNFQRGSSRPKAGR